MLRPQPTLSSIPSLPHARELPLVGHRRPSTARGSPRSIREDSDLPRLLLTSWSSSTAKRSIWQSSSRSAGTLGDGFDAAARCSWWEWLTSLTTACCFPLSDDDDDEDDCEDSSPLICISARSGDQAALGENTREMVLMVRTSEYGGVQGFKLG